MNIRHYRGDNKTLELTVRDAIGEVDLTGMKIWFTVKKAVGDPDSMALIKKSTANVPGGGDEQIKVTANGKAEIYIVPADTANLILASYDWYYDVQVKTSEDKVYTVKQGTFRLLPEITHSG